MARVEIGVSCISMNSKVNVLVSHEPDMGLTKSTPKGKHSQNDCNSLMGWISREKSEAMRTLSRTKIYKYSNWKKHCTG